MKLVHFADISMANNGNGRQGKHHLENKKLSEKLPSTNWQKPLDSNNAVLSTYIDSWRQTDEAGSHLLYSLCNLLAGSQYEGVAKEIGTSLGHIYANSESELVLSHVKDIDKLMSGIGINGKDPKKLPASQQQVLLRCLLLLVRLQGEYHQMCSNAVSRAIEHLVQHSITMESDDILQQISSLELHKLMSCRQSPSHSSELKKPNTHASSSPKLPKSLKASLFSLFDRKNSPEEGTSSFYVDLSQSDSSTVDNNGKSSQSGSGEHVTMDMMDNRPEMLVELGLDPSVQEMEKGSKIDSESTSNANSAAATQLVTPTTSGMAPPQPGVPDNGHTRLAARNNKDLLSGPKGKQHYTGVGVGVNGEVASQEELDSVINLLSGVTTAAPPMQTIPEHQDQLSLQVPCMYSAMSPATSDSAMEDMRSQHAQVQRRSEGSLDLSGFGHPGRNTWPNKHRSSLPGGNTSVPPPSDYPGNPAYPRGYGADSRPAMTLPPGGVGQFPPGYQWAFPDPKLNRTWPMNNLTGMMGSVTDTMNSSWSGAPDSDDLSDDSSCGDQFTAAVSQRPPIDPSGDQFTAAVSQRPPIDPRRDVYKDEPVARKTERVPEGRHHSLEDLLDVHSTNMWPSPIQPWSQPGQPMEPVPLYDNPGNAAGYHRPVQMQWSDPLSNKQMWPLPGADQQPAPGQSHTTHAFGQM